MDIETWDIQKLIEYDRNPRRNDHAVDKVAAAIKEYGFKVPIIAKSDGLVVDGHLRLKAAKKLKVKEVPVILADDLTDAQVKAFRISVNKMADIADWDDELLRIEFGELEELGIDLELTGFDVDEISALIPEKLDGGLTDPDDVQEPPAEPTTKRGDIWQLGRHRLMCGDSTSAQDVAALMDGKKAALLHADPPYGMGKQKDGVENDNLYADKLDRFQMQWWQAFRPCLEDNASAYIWGNAAELWRLWYRGGLAESERMTFRNEIVWDKGGGGFGVGTEAQRCFFPEERCLFFMLGEQGFNNNADNYWEGFEPVRSYLQEQRDKLGWKNKDVADFFGFHPRMADHWFSKSQWSFPTEEQYLRLQKEANGAAFKREYDSLKREYDSLKREFYATRAYFDNTHDNMTDVWEFQRVTGEERHGHATPKPVAMMQRVMRSSLPADGLCVEPFSGSRERQDLQRAF